MVKLMDGQLDSRWNNLEREIKEDEVRRFIRLDLEKESGIRLAIISPGNYM